VLSSEVIQAVITSISQGKGIPPNVLINLAEELEGISRAE
jgi:hypothetical protein